MTDNYRPISLLSVFNNLFEKCIARQLVNFLETNKVFYDFQFGFRKLFSTSFALLELVDMIKHELDSGHYVMGVFIDFKKAFDTVDHAILLEKLSYYGVRGHVNNFFKSYLLNRSQYTVINDIQSSTQPITCGVPQGSVLGPILFLLYINDIYKITNSAKVRLFADDTSIYFKDKSVDMLKQDSVICLTELFKWCNCNKLTVHENKCSFILFSTKKQRNA